LLSQNRYRTIRHCADVFVWGTGQGQDAGQRAAQFNTQLAALGKQADLVDQRADDTEGFVLGARIVLSSTFSSILSVSFESLRRMF
jgi:hypothetical protein